MSRNPALHRAYLATCYRILRAGAEQPLDMRIGEHDPQLDQTLQQQNVDQGAFLTACNPHSQSLSDNENRKRMAALQRSLNTQGWLWWPGTGIPAQSDWSPEASVFVLGMDLPTARTWGRLYAQNALVHVSQGRAPELIWLVD